MTVTTIVSTSATILEGAGVMTLTLLSGNTAAGVLSEKTLQALAAIDSAADTALFDSGMYINTAGGLAATVDGEYFSVPSPDADEFSVLYLNSSGTAVEQKRFPTAAMTQAAIVAASAAALSETAAADSAAASSGFADDSAASAALADADRVAAEQARDAAYSVAQSSGVYIYDTKALATAAVAGLADLSIVEVLADESQSGSRTRYRKESGSLVFKISMDQTRTDLADTADTAKGAALVGSNDGSGGSFWTTVAGFIARIGPYFKSVAAGGSTSSGRNIVIGHTGNAVASDIGTATICGGGLPGRENIIGGDGSVTVNTGTPNVVSIGTNADYSVITGGYDNVAGGLASVISGFHNYTGLTSTHGTIAGGSAHKIELGDYNTIVGGTINRVSGGTSYAFIGGGGQNVINVVAGQNYGTIGGGFSNTVSARNATVSGGNQNIASGVSSTVSGGGLNTAFGENSVVSGGYLVVAGGRSSAAVGGESNTINNTASRADYSGILAGYTCTIGSSTASRFSGVLAGRDNAINAEYAATMGGRYCAVTGEAAVAHGYGAAAISPGEHARASGYFSAAGDAQASALVMRRQTTDATPTELRLGSTLGSRLALSNDSVYAFSILVVGRGTASDAQRGAYKIEGCISVTAAGVPAIVGSPTVTVLAEDNAAWDASVAADTTNKALQVLVTGAAATTINWVADVRLVKVAA